MTETDLPRIQRIEVKKLFDLYDHAIELKLDDQITILHGPNGVGKTVILSMVNALFSGNFSCFRKIPFHEFSVSLTDGNTFAVSEQIDKKGNRNIHLLLRDHSGKTLGKDKINILDLIETQRLQQFPSDRGFRPDTSLVSTLNEYAGNLQKRIEEAMAEYGQTSQKLDQSFPQRLLTHTKQISAEKLKKNMAELDAIQEELKEISILDETAYPSNPFNIEQIDTLNDAQKSVMTLYVQDTRDKLQVLEDVARRIKVFLENLNRKFQHKTIKIDRKEGFIVKGYDNKPLPLASLSSGEQHELVLHYHLLFNVQPNTLVLIDEPELSLHLSWQKRFLQDLLEIVKVANVDALIATHSPFIVGERSDLMAALDVELETEKA